MTEEWFKGTHGHKGVSSTQQGESIIRQAVEQQRKRCADVVRSYKQNRPKSELGSRLTHVFDRVLDEIADTIEKGE